jgi:hypothetical protein
MEKKWTSIVPKDLENDRLDQPGYRQKPKSWVQEIGGATGDNDFDLPEQVPTQGFFEFKEMSLADFKAYYGVPTK